MSMTGKHSVTGPLQTSREMRKDSLAMHPGKGKNQNVHDLAVSIIWHMTEQTHTFV